MWRVRGALAAAALVAGGAAFGDDRVSLISHQASLPPISAASGTSVPRAMSADGRYVAYQSAAEDLIEGISDGNISADTFVWDRETELSTLISHVAASPLTTADGHSQPVAISSDGRYVLFSSKGANLIAGAVDVNGSPDVFLWDAQLDLSTLISHANGLNIVAGNGSSEPKAMSADGRYVAFDSTATNLLPVPLVNNGTSNAFLWDRGSNFVWLVSHAGGATTTAGNGGSGVKAISADGRFVAFVSDASNLIEAGTDANASSDAFEWDRDNGTVRMLSHTSDATGVAANGTSSPTAISADGRYVAFGSNATDLIAGGSDGNGTVDAYLWDHETNAVRLVSHTPGAPLATGDGYSNPATISADGRYVAFESQATDLVAGFSAAPGHAGSAYLWDRVSGTVTLISHTPQSPTSEGDPLCSMQAMSPDGRFVVFSSAPPQLGVELIPGREGDAYRWDRLSGEVTLVTAVQGSANTPFECTDADPDCVCSTEAPAISSNGTYVAYGSIDANLVADGIDTNSSVDAFLWAPDALFANGFE